MEALKIDGLSKSYGGLEVLNNISFSVQEGEHVGIIGPNGAGKTTLINAISGEFPVIVGRVFIFGEDITGLPRYARIHRGLSRSFQITRVFGSLTIFQNMLLALQGKKPSRYQMQRPATTYPDVNTKAEELLRSLGLWENKDKISGAISHGERRKLEIALSLASEPRILLLDEPSAGLDVDEVSDFITMIKTMSKDITLLFSAHDMDVVFGLADRILVLFYGQFIADGGPEEIRVNPKVQEIYLGVEDEGQDAAVR
jgi:branched-chain amino acid transport system ATP-binding protein